MCLLIAHAVFASKSVHVFLYKFAIDTYCDVIVCDVIIGKSDKINSMYVMFFGIRNTSLTV